MWIDQAHHEASRAEQFGGVRRQALEQRRRRQGTDADDRQFEWLVVRRHRAQDSAAEQERDRRWRCRAPVHDPGGAPLRVQARVDTRQPPRSAVQHARTELAQRCHVLGRRVPLVLVPAVVRVLGRQVDHHRVALALGQDARGRHGRARPVGLDPQVHPRAGTGGLVVRREQVGLCGAAEPVVRAVQEHDVDRSDLQGRAGQRARARQPQGGDDARPRRSPQRSRARRPGRPPSDARRAAARVRAAGASSLESATPSGRTAS